ncbi:hypothetical protein GCM10023314_31010 [Algibacter agarivorans]|uniref:Uncharacterized protein n=1 Tax=Algibacter agarivorans TaxID=1109741 RepID=A0ABP9GWJ4_9FLAO
MLVFGFIICLPLISEIVIELITTSLLNLKFKSLLTKAVKMLNATLKISFSEIPKVIFENEILSG